MTDNKIEFSRKKLGRITGQVYLVIISAGLFGALAIRGNIFVPNDALTSLHNLLEQEFMFRIGFMSDLAMVIADIIISILFYYLLKDVNKFLAFSAMVFRLIQSSILGINLLNLFSPILLIANLDQSNPLEMTRVSQELLFQMDLFDYGYLISGVFFAINCLIMGYLLYISVHFPKILGIMIAIASSGYMFNCIASFIAPQMIEISQIYMFFTAVIAEIALCIYLIVIGSKTSDLLEL